MTLFYRIIRRLSYRRYLAMNAGRLQKGKSWIKTKGPSQRASRAA